MQIGLDLYSQVRRPRTTAVGYLVDNLFSELIVDKSADA